MAKKEDLIQTVHKTLLTEGKNCEETVHSGVSSHF